MRKQFQAAVIPELNSGHVVSHHLAIFSTIKSEAEAIIQAKIVVRTNAIWDKELFVCLNVRRARDKQMPGTFLITKFAVARQTTEK